jgi:pyruvate/2-oxoglutarate dehydrogenase complex dihydrolipoamide acyltransferase (E2) component
LDEPLLEVSTDKVNSEIPSPVAGRLVRTLAAPDEELQVGDPLAKIVVLSAIEKGSSPTPSKEKVAPTPSPTTSEMSDFFSPAVLRTASELGVSLEEMKKSSLLAPRVELQSKILKPMQQARQTQRNAALKISPQHAPRQPALLPLILRK